MHICYFNKGKRLLTLRLKLRLNTVGTKGNPPKVTNTNSVDCIYSVHLYTLQLIGPISYLGACYIRTKVTKCIREKMTMYFRG